MTDEIIRNTVARAVEQAYKDWAAEHPSLAAVIDRTAFSERAAESLRDSEDYRQAVAGYHRGLTELELLNTLMELARPILSALLIG